MYCVWQWTTNENTNLQFVMCVLWRHSAVLDLFGVTYCARPGWRCHVTLCFMVCRGHKCQNWKQGHGVNRYAQGNKTNCVHDVHGTVKNETSQYKSMIWVILLAPLKNGARTDQLPAKLKGGHWWSRLVIMLIKFSIMRVFYEQIELGCVSREVNLTF